MVAELMLFIDIRTHRRDLVVRGNVTQFVLLSHTLVVRNELQNGRVVRIRRKRMSHVLMMLHLKTTCNKLNMIVGLVSCCRTGIPLQGFHSERLYELAVFFFLKIKIDPLPYFTKQVPNNRAYN